MHRPKAKTCLLKCTPLALLLLSFSSHSATAAAQHSEPPQQETSVFQRFLSPWFTNKEVSTGDTDYPLWSTRNLRGDESNVLFSYNVPAEVAERYRGGRRGLQTTDAAEGEVEEVRKRGPDPPVPVHIGAHEMVVHVTYEDIYAILVFLILATALGIFTSKMGMPALVGEIFAGFLFGPPLANFVPFPEALVLVGEIGLIMLLLEAGVELDVAQLKETGLRAIAIGCTGTILPLFVGMGLAMASGPNVTMKAAMAVGASFSPTSLGVAASALKSGKMLDTPVGQLIVASCVIDDILALILLSMFKVLVRDNPPIYQYFIPIISSLGFLLVLGGSAVTWMPGFIQNTILKAFPKDQRELVMFAIMITMVLAYLPLLNYTQASYLTGAFLAGVPFSLIPHAHHTFMEKTHQFMTWLLRVFFAATIGFQVPVKQFGNPYVIGWGFILYICVIAKLPLAFYVPQFEDVKKGASYNPFVRDRLICALAMTCRGEFSFIIAAFALSAGLFTAQMYAAIVFAVLLSCITSPFMLLNMIKYFNKKQKAYFASTNPLKGAIGKDAAGPLFLHIKATATAFGGMQEQFRKIVNELGLEVVERRTNRNGRGLDATVQTDLYVRDSSMSVNVQRIGAQQRIKRALDADTATGSLSGGMISRLGSIRLSSNDLCRVTSLGQMDRSTQEDLQTSATVQDNIIKRGEEVEKSLKDVLGEGAEVSVEVWNPWPWQDVLDKITVHYGLTGEGESLEAFQAIFDRIDADGDGEIEQSEFYEALINAGIDNITEEGVLTLFAMIDEDGSGEIDRKEWDDTVNFYLELKREEDAMHQDDDEAVFAREAQEAKRQRAVKLATLRHDKKQVPKKQVPKVPSATKGFVPSVLSVHEFPVAEEGSDFDPVMMDDEPVMMDDEPIMMDDGPVMIDDGPVMIDDGSSSTVMIGSDGSVHSYDEA